MRHGAEWQDIFAEQSPEDSDLWLDLIMYASVMNDDLAAILVYLRNSGTKLVKNDKYGYRLVPVISDHAWNSMEQYKQESRDLKPFQEQLVYCLRKLSNSVRDKSIEQPKETPLWEQ